jgi:hypothetical protein
MRQYIESPRDPTRFRGLFPDQIATLRKLRAEQVNLFRRGAAMSLIATGKKKTMNQGFTTTERGIIGVKSSLAGLV